MKVAPEPPDEARRLEALRNYNVLDTLPEQDFDDITHIAAQICNTPVALISLVDQDRQWFKSRVGLDAEQTPRDLAFCAHAILNPEEVFEVPDAHADERFHDNPLVVGEPKVRFYAGASLIDPEGNALGTLCVIDHEERELSQDQKDTLNALSRQVMAQLELRKSVGQLESSERELERANDELKRFAYMASHDLKTPLRGLRTVLDWLESDCAHGMDKKALEYLEILKERGGQMEMLVQGILDYSRASHDKWKALEIINVDALLNEVIKIVELPEGFQINCPEPLPEEAKANRIAMHQIFQNLLTNAIRYNDKDEGRVDIAYVRNNGMHEFHFSDNGPGIEEKFHDRIFQMFETLGEDRHGQKSTGIGLATTRRLAEKLGGRVDLRSRPGEGATFSVYLPA